MRTTPRNTKASKPCNRRKPSVQPKPETKVNIPAPNPCPQLPGAILRVFIPAGTVINLLNLIELNSPSGICLIIRLPILGGGFNLGSLFNTVQEAGGTINKLNN